MEQQMFMVDFENDNDAHLIFVPPESEIDWLIKYIFIHIKIVKSHEMNLF